MSFFSFPVRDADWLMVIFILCSQQTAPRERCSSNHQTESEGENYMLIINTSMALRKAKTKAVDYRTEEDNQKISRGH